MRYAIPSPPVGVWHLGPLPIRAYALAILTGIVVAVFIARRRFLVRGGTSDQLYDVVTWAVPFGIVGGRIYHVITSPAAYFGPGGDPLAAFAIWEGGLGIWGAIALGAVGAYIGCRRYKVRFAIFADVLAPALLVAQAIGRLGNWFNQELFGGPTSLPWGLRIDDAHLPLGYASGTLFHPTFLYEMLWNLGGAAVLIWLGRRLRLHTGCIFWLYVVWYTLGRGWIEMMRIDPAEHIAGMRLNVWTSILVGLLAIAMFVWLQMRPERVVASSGTGQETAAGGEQTPDVATQTPAKTSAATGDNAPQEPTAAQ